MEKEEITAIVAFTMNQLEKEYGVSELSDFGGKTCDEIVDSFLKEKA